jgi:hypothetical protein
MLVRKLIGGAAVLLLLVAVSFSVAQDKGAKPGDTKDHEIVIVELGESESTEVEFDKPTVVRVTGSTPVGIGKLSVKLTGAAKVVREAKVSRIIGGQKPIGAAETEYEIQLGKGLSKVEVISTVKGADPKVETYKFDVK